VIRLPAAVALLLAGASGAAADGYDQAFVDAFAEACVPGRLSYVATLETANGVGWEVVGEDSHPILAKIMATSRAMMEEDADLAMEIETTLHAREVESVVHHLVVTRVSAVIGDDTDPWIQVGCHLYNFEATSPLDPAPVTALIGNPISSSQENEGAISHIWGPPCPMPRTGDTYLNFVPAGSNWASQLGFSGVALNFSTSEPDPGEVVPETYC
jgi:hypothetical protein